MATSENTRTRVSVQNPCPICGAEDWCLILGEEGNAVICPRTQEAPAGWKLIKTAANGQNIFAREGSGGKQRKEFPTPEQIFPLESHPQEVPQWTVLSTVGEESEKQIQYFYPDPITGEPLGKVVRKQWSDRRPVYGNKGSKKQTKEIRPEHWVEPSHPDQGPDGWWSDRGKGKKPWPLYRQSEVAKDIQASIKVVFSLAGEQAVETAREIGLTAFCNQGGEGSYLNQKVEFLKANTPELTVIWPDCDKAGYKAAAKELAAYEKAGIPAVVLDPRAIWNEMPEKGDIYNVVYESGMDKFEFIRKLEAAIHQAVDGRREELQAKEAVLQQEQERNSDPDYVGKGTVEALILRSVFEEGEGVWRTLEDTFYKDTGNGYWKRISDKTVLRMIATKCCSAYELRESQKYGIQKYYPFATDAKKSSAFKFCRDKLAHDDGLANTHLRAFLNCTVDLRTGEAIPHDPAHFLTTSIAAEYLPNQPCPEVFLGFIKEAYGEDLVEPIRAYTSMLLDPTAPYGVFIHLMGPSGSGKGTLLRLWGEMFGLDHFRSGDFKNLATAEGRHQYLTGAALFTVPDVGGYVQGLKPFYELVDNGPMSGRALFSSNGYQKLWNTRFVIASVDHLQIENSGDGWDRRCRPLPTKARKGIEDPDLGRKLAEVKGQIISWALAMPREERDRLLLYPSTNERVLDLKLDASTNGDPVRAFVDLCLRPCELENATQSHELHTFFGAFAQAHGYQGWGMSKLINHLKTILPQHYVPRKKYQGEMVPAHWVNLRPLYGAFVDVATPPEGDEAFAWKDCHEPVWKCVKSGCKEGGLVAFVEFRNGSPGSPDPSSFIKVADPQKNTENQGFQESGSPGSAGSQGGVGELEAIANRMSEVREELEIIDRVSSADPLSDLADLTDPVAETLDTPLAIVDHPLSEVTDPGDPVIEPVAELEPEPEKCECAECPCDLDQQPDQQESTDEAPLKVGDRVEWLNCPPSFSEMNPFVVREIKGEMVCLDFVWTPVNIRHLKRYQG